MGQSGSSMSSYPGQRSSSMQRNPDFRPDNASTPGSGQRQSSAVSTISRPGSYAISRNSTGSTQVFRVTIPNNARPGGEFQVYAGNRVVRVRCPNNARPGMTVQITVPAEDIVTNVTNSGMAVLTSAEGEGGGGAVRMNSETRILNANTIDNDDDHDLNNSSHVGNGSASAPSAPSAPQQPQAYNVVVPPNVNPGQVFPVSVNGRTIRVQCPQNARAGMTVRITPPPTLVGPPPGMQSATNLNRPPDNPAPGRGRQSINGPTRTVNQVFEVRVPAGIRPNQQFALMAGGQRVLVACPPTAQAGSMIRFSLPMSVGGDNSASGTAGAGSKNGQIKNVDATMKYDTQDGWTRSIQVTDMTFTWIRLDDKGEAVFSSGEFDVETSAYVRKIVFLEGNDKRMRTGKVTLVPASEYRVDSAIYKETDSGEKGEELVKYADIANVQKKNFDDKVTWFMKQCKRLGVPWEDGHMRICVKRENLLADSIKAVMSLGRDDMKKIWRFEFMGEMGIDAGGLAKEWFLLVTKAIFDGDSGLWLSSEGNQMLMRINPASEVSCPEDHLIYFRFLGRVLGKALFEGQIVSGHMVQYLYKYMLGWPVTFEDLQSVDQELHQNLKKLLDIKKEEVEYMCLDFTAAQSLLGETTQVLLTPNGEDVAVTGDNLMEYLEVYFKYCMLERIKPQVTELLLGFYDVIPEPLLTVFDFQELELMMCGLPTIDLDDWKKNTVYKGLYESGKGRSQTIKWFWEIVSSEFDQEMRARLLQFVTGTSGVPSRGFSVLQGSDGNIKLFTINGVTLKHSLFPRAHTCFNRIDLPVYNSKRDLREKLKIAVTQCATGFTHE